MPRTLNRARRSHLRPRVKVWFELDGEYAFGFGIAEMLQAVERTGSIKEAARALGKSYRYVWGRIKAAEATLGQTLVEAQVGGTGTQRSAITPAARELAHRFLAMRRRLTETLDKEFAQRFRSS